MEMNVMQLKSEQNFNAANVLLNNEIQYYAPAIHCFYYSCFQLSKYVLATFCEVSYEKQEQESKGEGSHQYVHHETAKALEKISHIAFLDYNSCYSKLKSLRKKADYSLKPISPEDVDIAKKKAEVLEQLLKNKYDIK